jgi:hypothetical protein
MPEAIRAYRESLTHSHRYEPLTAGIEICSCGSLRAAYPDESIHPKEVAKSC